MTWNGLGPAATAHDIPSTSERADRKIGSPDRAGDRRLAGFELKRQFHHRHGRARSVIQFQLIRFWLHIENNGAVKRVGGLDFSYHPYPIRDGPSIHGLGI